MALRYDENPFLFVNATDSSIPSGRNVRSQSRAQQAAIQHGGHPASAPQEDAFAVLDFRQKRPREPGTGVSSNKPRKVKRVPSETPKSCDAQSLVTLPCKWSQANVLTYPWNNLAPDTAASRTWAAVHNPANTLIVAAFHIRRMTSAELKLHPERLTDVLRFRQWSCVPVAIERFGTNACLDSALACLAIKLDRMTGGATPYHSLLATHTEALHQLQQALAEPQRHNLGDLLTATQLLAVFEMLDSLDNGVWLQHVAGAESLLRWKKVQFATRKMEALGLGMQTVAPMMTDALLTGNVSFFEQSDWESSIDALTAGSDSAIEADVLKHLLDVVQLTIDFEAFNPTDASAKFKFLDRAHGLRARLRDAVVELDVYSRYELAKLESFDRLGLYVAGMIALDRVIASLRPIAAWRNNREEETTSSLCEQMLQLELKQTDDYPDSGVISAFQLST